MTNADALPEPLALRDQYPGALDTILLGGLAIGVLDFLDATLFFALYSGAPFQRIWQGVSSGLSGSEAARAGGWATALLGIFLHFIISFGIATVYFIGARKIPLLIRHPVVSGLIFGVMAHLVMRYVVVPLSAIGAVSPYNLPNFLNSVIGHALLVGLPVALIAAWSAARRSRIAELA
ncbi:MAG: hypothetical protein ABI481_00475 [Pyrinomonadaceae bacterium]